MDIKEKISNHYTNKYGFYTYNLAASSDPDNRVWDSDNNHLWTGQVNILLYYKMLLTAPFYHSQVDRFKRTLESTEIVRGLHTRHAPRDIYMNSNKWDEISLDEHQGICMSAIALGWTNPINEIYNYGRKTGFAYIEKRPHATAFPKITAIGDWFKLLYAIYRLIKYGIENKDYKGSGEMDKEIFKYPLLQNLSRKRLPKDVYHLKRCAGVTPSIIETLHFMITALHTLKYPADQKISGKNRLVYALLTFKLCGFTYLEKTLNGYTHKKLKEMYGWDYIYQIHKRYFWNTDNPIFKLAKNIDLEIEA